MCPHVSPLGRTGELLNTSTVIGNLKTWDSREHFISSSQYTQRGVWGAQVRSCTTPIHDHKPARAPLEPSGGSHVAGQNRPSCRQVCEELRRRMRASSVPCPAHHLSRRAHGPLAPGEGRRRDRSSERGGDRCEPTRAGGVRGGWRRWFNGAAVSRRRSRPTSGVLPYGLLLQTWGPCARAASSIFGLGLDVEAMRAPRRSQTRSGPEEY
jgi:hypothetical protein